MTERHFVETCVGRLAVRVVGEGQTAVLWPSLFVDERSWHRLVPTLAEDRRLVIINGPGHGLSGDPGHRYTNHDCAIAARQVLDQLAIGAIDWVGNAWGGHVGVEFATGQPQRCRSLIAIGAPIAALSGRERVRTYLLLAAYGAFGPVELVLSGVTDALLSAHTRLHDVEAVELVRDSLRGADRRMLRNAVVSISLQREALADLLPALGTPTLIVTGSDHSGFTPAQAEAAAQLCPDARTAVVADAAYLVPLEAPAATVALIREFWARCAMHRPSTPEPTIPEPSTPERTTTERNPQAV